jgi:hypothetical protein
MKRARKARGSYREKSRGKNVRTKRIKVFGVTVSLTAPKVRKRKARTARSLISGRRPRARKRSRRR